MVKREGTTTDGGAAKHRELLLKAMIPSGARSRGEMLVNIVGLLPQNGSITALCLKDTTALAVRQQEPLQLHSPNARGYATLPMGGRRE